MRANAVHDRTPLGRRVLRHRGGFGWRSPWDDRSACYSTDRARRRRWRQPGRQPESRTDEPQWTMNNWPDRGNPLDLGFSAGERLAQLLRTPGRVELPPALPKRDLVDASQVCEPTDPAGPAGIVPGWASVYGRSNTTVSDPQVLAPATSQRHRFPAASAPQRLHAMPLMCAAESSVASPSVELWSVWG